MKNIQAKIPIITATMISVAIMVTGESRSPICVLKVFTAAVMLSVVPLSKPAAVPACKSEPAMKKPTTLYTKNPINANRKTLTIVSPALIPLVIFVASIVIMI